MVVLDGEEGFLEKYPKYMEKARCLTLEEAFAIPDLEAAIVETDDTVLTQYAQWAAERGLHIQMDKPGPPRPRKL